ncbi:MAG TPA: SWIM zinc finger family protein, partial [Armatimonadota bacterium]|nr:SWIM zinc finger family protein [Armatimonadota bacterium]
MTAWEELSVDAVRTLAAPDVVARGYEYYRQGTVLQMVLRADQLHAEVQGSDVEPYHVTLTAEGGRVSESDCTCPYEWEGACKHIVAVLLAYFEKPERVVTRPPLEGLLASLHRERLQAMLLELAEGEPGLADKIEALALRGVPGIPAAVPAVKALPPVDPKIVDQQLQAAVRGSRRGRRYDYGAVSDSVDELQKIAEQARPYLEAGDGRSALVFLEAAAGYATGNIEELLGDEGLELGYLCEKLGTLLAEAFLTTDLSPEERQAWAKKVGAWERLAGDYGYEERLVVARYAAEQGWNYPPLRRVLEGEITERGAWEGEAPASADELAEVRLTLLERQGRWEEYLRLAEAEGQTERYVTALVRLRRIPEAVEYGLHHLSSRDEALALGKALDEAGASEDALRVAEHALTAFEAMPYGGGELSRWTRDLAARLGHAERALQAGLAAMRDEPSLANYLALQPLAGERWPELRSELLEALRRSVDYYPTSKIDIFLHEGLIDDAIAAVGPSPGH